MREVVARRGKAMRITTVIVLEDHPSHQPPAVTGGGVV
jgi:hypothetical protein